MPQCPDFGFGIFFPQTPHDNHWQRANIRVPLHKPLMERFQKVVEACSSAFRPLKGLTGSCCYFQLGRGLSQCLQVKYITRSTHASPCAYGDLLFNGPGISGFPETYFQELSAMHGNALILSTQLFLTLALNGCIDKTNVRWEVLYSVGWETLQIVGLWSSMTMILWSYFFKGLDDLHRLDCCWHLSQKRQPHNLQSCFESAANH